MPMTQAEFDKYCEHHAIGESTRAFLERVRNGDPARRTGKGYKNVACRFASKKMGFVIQAESEGPEFSFVMTLEFDSDALEFYDQPETLQVQAVDRNGKRITKPYTPDYLVLSQTEGPILYECKEDEQVETFLKTSKNWWMDKDGNVHYEPLRKWCLDQGIASVVALSSQIPAQRIQNLQMLADYYGSDAPVPTADARDRILTALTSPPWASRRQLLASDDQIQADEVNWMIAYQELWVDFDHQVLADDIRTLIFRNHAAYLAYQSLESTKVTCDPLQIRAVSLEKGSPVLWDGRPYTVIDHGETYTYLQDADKNMRELKSDDIDRFISEGLLSAPLSTDASISVAAYQRLSAASPKDLAAGVERLAGLRRGPDDPPVPKRTLERLRALYRRGEKLYGSGFLGLIPWTNKRGNRNPKLHPTVIEMMKGIVEELILVPDPQTNTACLGELELRCKEKSLTPPSDKTFGDFVRSLRKAHAVRKKKGHKAAHEFEPWHVRLSYNTPRHGQRPFEIGHIDHTELGLHFVDERYGKRTIRVWLTVLIDAYSRKILAWYLTFEKPSYRSAMCVIRNCLRKYGRGCDYYVVDQGAEFNGTNFEVLLARLGAHKKERPASKPRFGNIIERFFGLAEQEFINQLTGNNQFLKNPRSLSPSHDPTKRAIWTLREFMIAWEGWLESYYHEKDHGTLGTSPNLVFAEGLRRYGHRAHRRFPFDEAMRMLCLPEVSTNDNCLRIDAHHGFVKVHGVHYHADILLEGKHHRKRVPARYDPFDITRIYIHLSGQWHELRCAFAGDLEGFSVTDLQVFFEELRAKHSSSYVRHLNNRELLALYLRSVRKTEEVLAKARNDVSAPRDDTQPQNNPPADSATSSICPVPSNSSVEFDVNAHWGIGLEISEEYE